MSPTRLRLLVDAGCVAVALLEGLLSSAWSPSPLAIGLTFGAALVLLLRRRTPFVALVLTLPALLVASALVAPMIALFAVGRSVDRRPMLVLSGLLVFAAAIPQWWGTADLQDLVLSVIYAAMTSAAPIALGLLARTRAELAARLTELRRVRAEERRRERQEVLVVERTRIAREMHDVVSHHVSLIAVRAGAMQVGADSATVREDSRLVRSLAVETLEELRRMVTVLRSTARTGDEGAVTPQPRVDDIPALVRASELDVQMDLDLPPDLPAATQRALYRATQEGLTNVRKHAPGAQASVRARCVGTMVCLVIANDVMVRPSQPLLPGSGHGLVGLRERADLLGGELLVRRTDTRFELEVRLPKVAAPARRLST